jgi:hypothetical protein
VCRAVVTPTHLVYEDGTDTRFRNVDSLNSDAGAIPKRKYSTGRPCVVPFGTIIEYGWLTLHLTTTPRRIDVSFHSFIAVSCTVFSIIRILFYVIPVHINLSLSCALCFKIDR